MCVLKCHPQLIQILLNFSKGSDTFYIHVGMLIISSSVQADYRQDGKEELIVCSVDGEVRGYLPAGIDQVSEYQSLGLGLDSKELQELTQKRQV